MVTQQKKAVHALRALPLLNGGEGGIRTHGSQRDHLISSQARSASSGTSPKICSHPTGGMDSPDSQAHPFGARSR